MTQTIGQKLKQAREAQKLTLEKASEATRIRAPYLQALETDDLSAMPSPVQARGFLRNYAEHLGLNIEQLLDEMRAEQKPADEIIGPADSANQVATQTPEFFLPQSATLLSTLEPDSASQAEPQPEPALEKTKRRGRKKVELELEPEIIEPQPEIGDEPVVQVEAEPVVESAVEEQPLEVIPQPDVTENLWQTWLNRISSVMPNREKKSDSDIVLP